MPRKPVLILLSFTLLAACGRAQTDAPAAPSPVERGAYLATIGGCHDCHTPKVPGPNGPELDLKRQLMGHPAEELLPAVPPDALGPGKWGALTVGGLTAWAGPWGTSFAANLTPHATGLGPWSEQEFIQALRTGRHAGVGRPILPPMPWPSYAKMPDEDLKALFAFLRSVPPIENRVPEPVPPPPPPPAPPSPTSG